EQLSVPCVQAAARDARAMDRETRGSKARVSRRVALAILGSLDPCAGPAGPAAPFLALAEHSSPFSSLSPFLRVLPFPPSPPFPQSRSDARRSTARPPCVRSPDHVPAAASSRLHAR